MNHRISRRSVTVLIGASVPVLLAAVGCQAAPAAPTAVPVTVTDKLFLMTDTVNGGKNVPTDQPSCAQTNRYARNSEVVWRTRVFDPKTGNLMDDKALASVQIQLANGAKLDDMKYGAHPPKSQVQEFYWTGSWVIPKDSPTGSVGYTVVATAADKRTGTFKPYNVATSLLTVTDQTLADIAAP